MTSFAEAQTFSGAWLQIIEKTDSALQKNSVPERRDRDSDYSVILNVPSQSADFEIDICFEGSATYGDDFQLKAGEKQLSLTDNCYTVEVPQNETRIKLTISILKDDVDEHYETVNITLKRKNNTPSGLTLSSHAAIFVIRDVLVNFTKSVSTAMENEGTVNIPVKFNFAPKQGFTLGYTVTGTADSGSDYSTLTGEIEVPSGTTTLNIPVKIIDDGVGEKDETVILSLKDSESYQVGQISPTHTLTIEENDGGIIPDKPVITISGGTRVIEGGNAIFTLRANPK
ncbi:MAG: hypothetical protein OXH90_07110, partial [Paracoccaceae bacterium]|nr:hypothetical protein [Paracoccaceae bacterium]